MLVYRQLFLGVVVTVFLVASVPISAMAEMLVLYCTGERSIFDAKVGKDPVMTVMKYRFTINLDSNTATVESKLEPFHSDYTPDSLGYRLQAITATGIIFRAHWDPRSGRTGGDVTISIDRMDGSFVTDMQLTNGHTENHGGSCTKGTQSLF